MANNEVPSIDWNGLLQWYMSADAFMADLDTCCEITRSMPTGSVMANFKAAQDLGDTTRNAEFWLLEHPCPEEWNAKYLWNIVQMFIAIGELVVSFDGVVHEGAADPLTQMIDSTCAMVEDAYQVNRRLVIEHVTSMNDGLSEYT